jgi:hypothetical protein
MYLDQVETDEGKDTYSDTIIDHELSSPSAEATWQLRHRPPAAMTLTHI